jgi:hypothetical protein
MDIRQRITNATTMEFLTRAYVLASKGLDSLVRRVDPFIPTSSDGKRISASVGNGKWNDLGHGGGCGNYAHQIVSSQDCTSCSEAACGNASPAREEKGIE